MRRRHIPVRALAGVTGALLTLALVPASGAVAASTRYEAESATISQGTVATNHTGFSGTGFVDYTNVVGSYVQWTVSAPTAGPATVGIRYANGGPNVDYLNLTTGRPGMAVAPYEYFGWGSPQNPTTVMSQTGITWFTL